MIAYITTSMGDRGKQLMDQYQASLSKLTLSDLDKLKVKNNQWNQSFKKLIEENIPPNSKKAQDLIAENYKNNILPYYKPSHNEFIKLIELSITHPKSKNKYDQIHPDFSCFYLQAIKHFIQNGLTDNLKL